MERDDPKQELRSMLLLGPQNPVDRAKPGPAAASPHFPGTSRPASALPTPPGQRPLTGVPGIRRPQSRAAGSLPPGSLDSTRHEYNPDLAAHTLNTANSPIGVPRPASRVGGGTGSLSASLGITRVKRPLDATSNPNNSNAKHHAAETAKPQQALGLATVKDRKDKGVVQQGEMQGHPKAAHAESLYSHASIPRGVKPRVMDENSKDTREPGAIGASRGDASQPAEQQAGQDDEVQARIRKWYQLLQLFKRQPDSIEFVYLQNAEPNSVHYNPYNLNIVPHAAVKGQGNYYTMSSQGITHFWDGQAEFCALEQFEREYFLYIQLMKLRMFQMFHTWKAFRVWRRGVAARKVALARESLTTNLFLLHPIFRDALLRVRAACGELSKLRLHALTPGKVYSLDELATAQAAQKEVVDGKLSEFSASVCRVAQDACFRAIELLEQELIASKDKSNQAKKLAAAGAATVRLAVTKAAQMANEAEFSYAINAAQRSEKRRIHSFVRLLDYLVCNTLHGVLMSSVSDMASALTPTTTTDTSSSSQQEATPSQSAVQNAEMDDADVSLQVSLQPTSNGFGGPLLKLDVLMQEKNDSLVLAPPPENFYTTISKHLSTWVEQVKQLGRLLMNDKLQELMEKPLDGGDVDLDGFANIIVADEDNCIEAVGNKLHTAMQGAEKLMNTFTAIRDAVVANRAITPHNLRSEYQQGVRDLDTLRQDMTRLQDQLAAVNKIQTTEPLGILEVHLEQLVAVLRPSFETCLSHIRQLLPQLAAEAYAAFITKVHTATSRLQHLPTSVEEFAEYLELYASIEKLKPAYDKEYDQVVAHYDLIQDFNIKVPDMQMAAFQTMDSDYTSLRDAMWSADSNREALVNRFRADLDSRVESLGREVVDIRLLAQHDMILDENSDQDQVLQYTSQLLQKVEAQLKASEDINNYRRLFKLEEAQFPELQDCADDVSLRNQLWVSRSQWTTQTAQWLSSPLMSLPEGELEEAVAHMNKVVHKAERGLQPNKLVLQLRESVVMWRVLVPIIQNLRNPDLKERHWAKVYDALGVTLARDDTLTLDSLLQLKVMSCKDAIANISTEANQEAALEAMLEKINEKWRHVEFTVNNYKEMKDVYILGAVDDVLAVLEDSLVAVATISASRFVVGIRSEVEKTERQLRLFSDTLDEWLECQKQWLYLETIFSAADIQRQLPTEAKTFAQVDKQFKDIMRRTKDRPNAMQAATLPGLLEALKKCNDGLEQVQKNLEDYLETKRVSFPRFYFLSSDELLEILSQTRNVHAVQPHLQKCFDGIRMLDFGDDPKSVDIMAMVSGEGERVALAKNLKARGNVEVWLTAVESSMRSSLRALAKRGVKDYTTTDRTAWVLQNPAQLVIVVSNIFWCQAVEQSLSDMNTTASLQALFKNCARGLSDLTALVCGKLTSLQRKVLVALITIDVHNRDIVEQLMTDDVSSADEFGWQMQLRYKYDHEADQVFIHQVNARFAYCYEYLGAQPRLVVTPMTDRCYMTLTGALHMKLGGAPAGPAGTGKTETTKDLGKALGVQCVVFNCGENLDYKFMGKFFSGLAQCGAWSCFDEFNRIDIEVLSVVAQQLLVIQSALKAGLDRFLFEGREMRLIQTCGVFITMNPGYAGRTELPDNLKALFRPMAMMIPDYALVAEVMLFSEGFCDARNLSRKMVKLYKLASEQLSQQDHYDFGMRALKSVLVMAGALKRAHPDLSEDIVLIRAMRDSNIPKFLYEDARLFNAIVSDLFPGVEIPHQDFGVLQYAAQEACLAAGKQPEQQFITKVLQLYETFNVRFGVMLVGPTGGGKTVCYRTLADAMTRLRENNHEDPNFQAVHTAVLNPKAIKLGELYGEYNLLTNEWADGLASSLIRDAVADTTPSRHWIVFDGPVDAIWVENMNTVLDDNCTLCLPNSERIKLNPVTMRMLFEVQDLAVASPATVSRCGMVYVPPEGLGWRPYVKSWLARLARLHADRDADAIYPAATANTTDDVSGDAIHQTGTQYNQATSEFIYGLLDTHIDNLLSQLRAECKTALPCSDLNLVTSTTKIFTAMTHPSKGIHLPTAAGAELEESNKIALQYIFAFSCAWGLGGCLESSCWDKWDKIMRAAFDGIANYPAGSGTVFEYYLDTDRNFMFRHFDDLVPKFKYNPNIPYFQLLVPTADSVRYSFLLQACLEVRHSVLFTGATGVGKTAVAAGTLERLAPTHDLLPVTLNFSAQTSSSTTQAMIEAKLEKKRKRRFGAPAGKHIVLFVDDVSMPARDTFGSQPPLELLRQMLDFSGFYDRKKLFWKEVEGVTLCGACGPPGGGRQEVSPRFLRHFATFCLPPPSETSMKTIFSAILGGFLDTYFPAEVRAYVLKPIVDSSVEVYTRIAAELLPTPTKSHYTFNLRDVSKVFQGLLGIRAAQCVEPRKTFARLWAHETMRVFHDRLTCDEDKVHLKHMLHDMLVARFEVKETYEELFEQHTIIFGDYLKPGVPREERVYEEVTDTARLVTLLSTYLDDYNMEHHTPLKLVFFMDAVEHISRIARILRQPRGSAMLVGVGGSGKQSLTRFAAFISETQCYNIELTRSYGILEFREDLKKLYRIAGVEGRHVAFLFTDNHIVNEAFVEDINNLLNSGEITGLFAADEREAIFADIRQWVVDNAIEETRDAMWRAFINRVRDHLHLVLAMSPVGEAFRSRCRHFPSLINCCTIDWFSEWPADALLSVSTRFLESQDLGGEHINKALASMCVDIHLSVVAMADRFYQELRRRYYVTPKSYLDLLALYTTLLAARRQEMATARDRLINGLEKLQETNTTVDRMQQELAELQPILAAKTKDTQQLLKQVEAEGRDAEAIQKVVAAEEVVVKKKQVETQALKDDAQKDLEEVLPALEAAERALSALNKNDIVEIKTFTKPPLLVQLTMEGVCLLLQEKPDWDTAKRLLGETTFIKRLVEYDKDNVPEKVVRSLKRLIDDPTFTPDQVAKTSKAAMSMCLWVRAMDTYAKVAKIVEPKRMALRTAQDALDSMNAALAAKTAQLTELKAKVEALQRALESTQAELAELQQAADLSSKRLTRASKLISALGDESVRWKATAEELGQKTLLLVGDVFLSSACISYIGAFTGVYRTELTSAWMAKCTDSGIPVTAGFTLQSTLATAIEVREWNLQGLPTDALSIDNGILATRGSRWPLMIDPQDQANRWVKAMESKNGLRSLRATDPNILRTLENCIRLGSPVLLEDVGEGLDPALEPLLQKQTFTQGTRTLIRLGDSDVDYDPAFRFYMTTKLPNPHYLPEVCIKVNLINFTVTLKGLEDQLLGEVVRRERPELEEARDRLVLSISNDTRQLAELEDKVLKLLRDSTGNILDDEVLISTLNNSKSTSGLIVARVREAEETEKAINAAREVYRPLPNRASILYFVIADLAVIDPMYQHSLSYFIQLFNHCIDHAAKSEDLRTRLNSLMTFTTEHIYMMVCRGLFEAHKGIFSFLVATAIQREAGLISHEQWNLLLRGAAPPRTPIAKPASLAWITDTQWAAVQSLEAALPAFNQRLTSSLQEQAKLWQGFMQSPEPYKLDMQPYAAALDVQQACSAALPDEETTPGHVPVPGAQCPLHGFLLLLLVKALREDQLVAALQWYVAQSLGHQFTEPPPSSLMDVYRGSNPMTPVIFILSQGADPTAALSRLGESMNKGLGQRLHIISLGQGQGPIAESTMSLAIKSGDWVCLQNCHLAKSWMPRLERAVEDLQARYTKQQQFAAVATGTGPHSAAALARTDSSNHAAGVLDGMPDMPSPADVYDVHPDFRLWLTSMPSPHIPVPVLQTGIKVTQEPPKGVRANLLRTYAQLPEGLLDLPPRHPHKTNWRKLVFALSTFHALIQERRKFGSIGWNIPYGFSAGDLDCALLTLGMFLDIQSAIASPVAVETDGAPRSPAPTGLKANQIPWEALTYVTGQINYGGRVTDDNDRRLLMCILNKCYNPEVLEDGHCFTQSATYYMPPPDDVARYITHIKNMPAVDEPELFGLHANAAITFNLQEGRAMLDTMLNIQPRLTAAPSAGGTGKTPEDNLLEVLSNIVDKLPPELSKEAASVVRSPFAPLPCGQDNSLGTVLAQEMERFNSLRGVLARTCAELQRAVKGLAVMSKELEHMATALMNNQVPALWAHAAYPSLKPLASWVQDLVQRVAFMESWLTDGQPAAFWLPALFFPQGFMTAVLQNHARNTRMPIDRLSFDFDVKPDIKDPTNLKPTTAQQGVLMYGLYLESATWDLEQGTLSPAEPGEMTSALPPVHLIPAADHTPPANQYQCPLYKTSVRAGVLSTTGMSTNFVLYLGLSLPAGSLPDTWVLQGVAALCALSD